LLSLSKDGQELAVVCNYLRLIAQAYLVAHFEKRIAEKYAIP